MLRIALRRTAATASFAVRARIPSAAPRMALQHVQVRYESNLSRKEQDEKYAALRDWDAKVLTYEEVKGKALQPSPEKYLIDVREPDEVLQGSIPSSVNLPLSVLATAIHLPAAEFKEKYGFEKPRTDQEITFYCRSGKRSSTACDVAKRNGFTNLLNYKGSWLDWVEREGKKAA